MSRVELMNSQIGVSRSEFYLDLREAQRDWFDYIREMYSRIHRHYKHGLCEEYKLGHTDNSWMLSREVEFLSQDLWYLFKMRPEFWELERLSERVRGMASELQVGPRRLPYYTIPKDSPASFFPMDGW